MLFKATNCRPAIWPVNVLPLRILSTCCKGFMKKKVQRDMTSWLSGMPNKANRVFYWIFLQNRELRPEIRMITGQIQGMIYFVILSLFHLMKQNYFVLTKTQLF